MTQVVPPPDDRYKRQALDALASGGANALEALNRNKAEYDASRQAATGMALKEAARYGLGQPGQDALTAPINKSYDLSAANLNTQGLANSNRIYGMIDPSEKVFDTKKAAITAKLDRASSRGSGGGGGGGGGGKAPKEPKAKAPAEDSVSITGSIRADMQAAAKKKNVTEHQARAYLQTQFAHGDPYIAYGVDQFRQAKKQQKKKR